MSAQILQGIPLLKYPLAQFAVSEVSCYIWFIAGNNSKCKLLAETSCLVCHIIKSPRRSLYTLLLTSHVYLYAYLRCVNVFVCVCIYGRGTLAPAHARAHIHTRAHAHTQMHTDSKHLIRTIKALESRRIFNG